MLGLTSIFVSEKRTILLKSCTCSVDAGNAIWCQVEVIVTVADDAVLGLVAFSALTVAAVLHGADEHLAVPLHTCRRTHTQTHANTA